jgi:hypothetical protein
MKNNFTHLIIADWNGYNFKRRKKFGKNKINCGLLPLLDSISQYTSGREFKVTLVITYSEHVKYGFFSFKRKVTPKAEYYVLQEKFPFIENIIFKDNLGMDLGSYNRGLQELEKNKYIGEVILMNSSVRGPQDNNWLEKYSLLYNQNDDIGICGITMNSHNTNLTPMKFSPHIQSFFIYTDTVKLANIFDGKLPSPDVSADQKGKLIEDGEIGISHTCLKLGYGLRCSSFPDFIYYLGDEWKIPVGDIRKKKEYKQLANQI